MGARIELCLRHLPLVIFKPGEATALMLLLLNTSVEVDRVAFILLLFMRYTFELRLYHLPRDTLSFW